MSAWLPFPCPLHRTWAGESLCGRPLSVSEVDSELGGESSLRAFFRLRPRSFGAATEHTTMSEHKVRAQGKTKQSYISQIYSFSACSIHLTREQFSPDWVKLQLPFPPAAASRGVGQTVTLTEMVAEELVTVELGVVELIAAVQEPRVATGYLDAAQRAHQRVPVHLRRARLQPVNRDRHSQTAEMRFIKNIVLCFVLY